MKKFVLFSPSIRKLITEPLIMFKSLTTLAVLAACATNASALEFNVSQDRTTFEAAFAAPFTVETFSLSDHLNIPYGQLNSKTNLTFPSDAPIKPGDIKPGVSYNIASSNSKLAVAGGNLFAYGLLDYAPLYVYFDKPVHEFGFDSVNMSQVDVTVSFVDMSQKNFHTTATGQMFWGFTSVGGATISSVRIGSTHLFPPGTHSVTSFAVDNFTFAGGLSAPPAPIPSPIPEPETYALMLMGLAGVAWATKRKG